MSPRTDRALAWGLFAAAFLSLWATQSSVGFVRDESVYFAAGESYARWYRTLLSEPSLALTDRAIVAAFDFNHEHPALLKSLFGLSYLIFHEGLGLLRPAAALRLPAFAIAALIAPLLYLMGLRLFGRTAGLFAAASFFLVPRQFFNSHLACFDMPVAALWLLTVYTFFRAQEEHRYWIWCGLSFGLALSAKHNALFLPFVLGPFALHRAYLRSRESPAARAAVNRMVALFAAVAALYGVLYFALGPTQFQQRFLLLSPHTALYLALCTVAAVLLRQLWKASPAAFRAASPLVAMVALGPPVFYAFWPYLWHAPVERTAFWLAFHATHHHYTWFYLGKLLRAPPFPLEYVVVKTALTVPTSLFIPMAIGFISVLARGGLAILPRTRAWVRPIGWAELLVVVNAVVSIAIISHPEVPHFGGVKHWFPSMPFLSLLAGHSVARASESLRGLWARLEKLPRWAPAAALSGLLGLPALIALVRVHPYGTSYYSELAGGLPGAASLGMQRQFWSNNVTGVLDWLNRNAPMGARVYLHEVNGFSFRDYQRNGMLRSDLVAAGGPADAQLAAYQYHQEFKEHEFNIWQAFGTRRPVAGLYVDETPQVVVYRRP
ncbi:MAG: glycosyltransferase family 39 protein [Myxococcales bacterium]|nr:glycosyltransferase family 39 protein [Myxococcales bacterium]